MSDPILPYESWAPGTNQNSIPANNNSLRNEILNGLIISDAVTAQPGSPADGDAYIIPVGKTGLQWALFDVGDLAIFKGGTWYAFAPVDGIRVNVAGDLMTFDGSAGYVAIGGGGTPGGANTQIQFNDGGAFGGDADLVYNKTTNTLTVVNLLSTTLIMSGLLTTVVSATGSAGLRLPHGAAPSSPTNGDVWTTTAGMYARINGVTVGPFAAGGTFTGGTLTSALNEAPPVSLASAGTVNIGAAGSNSIAISGTTTITAFDTIAAGAVRRLRFQGALTLTHNGTSLIIPGAANITTAPDDVAFVESLGSGNWRVIAYTKANGQAIVGGGGGLSFMTESQNTASPNTTVYVSALTATGSTTNVDFAVVSKGSGATVAQIPTGTSAGGNKRNPYATDWQKARSNANQVAGGDYATISGGQNNGISSQHGTISGGRGNTIGGSSNYSTIGGGDGSSTAGANETIGGGFNNATSGGGGTIAGGFDGVVSGAFGQVTGGRACVASGPYSRAGGWQATTRAIHGMDAWAAGQFSAVGDNQLGKYVLRSDTTNATPEQMTTTNAAAAATNTVNLPNNSAYVVFGKIWARESGGNARFWDVEVGIVRGANAASTTLVYGGTPTILGTSGGFTGTAAITADTTLGGLAITVTGVAATNIKWGAILFTGELVG